MPAFKADSRLYARPLSYEYIDQAVPKELVVDYDKGDLYIKDSSGNVHSITVKVTEQIKEIIKEDPKTIIDNVKIEVTNPTTGEKETVTLEQTIINQYTYITNLLRDLDGYDDTSTEPPTHVPGVKDKVSGLDKDMNGYTDTSKNPPEYVPVLKMTYMVIPIKMVISMKAIFPLLVISLRLKKISLRKIVKVISRLLSSLRISKPIQPINL